MIVGSDARACVKCGEGTCRVCDFGVLPSPYPFRRCYEPICTTCATRHDDRDLCPRCAADFEKFLLDSVKCETDASRRFAQATGFDDMCERMITKS